jgi:hypothetical protein
MRSLRARLLPLALLARLAPLASLGCGPEFAPPSEVTGLRVLAVHQDPGSGSPGATVELDMLLADRRIIGSTDTDPAPELSVTWFAGCHNPPGRQYFACLPAVRELALAAGGGTIPPGELAGRVGTGTHFELPLPDDILSAAPLVAHDPIHYGVSYVFFVVCAGTPGFDPSITEGLPVTCTAADGKAVGPSGLVVGFTTIYSYDGVDNANPTMTSLDFDGEPMPVSTLSMPATPCVSDDECSDEYRHRRKCTTDTHMCAPVIGKCSGESCPELRVTPRIDTTSVERFTDGYEVMWASYYATSGEVSYPSRLVVDRVAGLAGDPSSGWRAPESAGTSRIWVTVNDQRGGAAWAFFDVAVE